MEQRNMFVGLDVHKEPIDMSLAWNVEVRHEEF